MQHRHRHRRTIGIALAAVVLGVCGVRPGPVLGSSADPAPASPIRADGAPTPGTTGALGRRAGFNPGSGILWMKDGDRQRELDAMAATGARWIALDFDWNSIQGDGPNSFRWDRGRTRSSGRRASATCS